MEPLFRNGAASSPCYEDIRVKEKDSMAATRHEPSKLLSEANGFVFTAGITAADRNRRPSKFFENLPGRACIEAKLADPRVLVEIAVVAVK